MGFPGGLESACNAGDLGSVFGLGRSPGEGNGYPLQYSCLETSHGQRSLAYYSLWGREELDITERLTLIYMYDETATFLFTYGEEEHVSANSPSLNTHI